MANKEGAKKEAAKTQPQNTMVKDAMALFIITIVAGLLLGAVYTITKDPIAAAEEKTTNEAYEAVYEGAEFKSNEKMEKKVEEIAGRIESGEFDDPAHSFTDVSLMEAKAAYVDGVQTGFVVKVSAKGYGGPVVIVVAVANDNEIIGINIVDNSNETPGLGQNSSKEDWYSQYVGINVMNVKGGWIEVTKSGDGSKEDGRIDAITGATITSNAVTRAVNMAVICATNLNGFADEQAE